MSMVYSGDSIQDTDGGVLRPISSVHRNRIINGAMVIDQRNAGASVTNPGNNIYTVDRWLINTTFTGSVGRNLNSVTPPEGFTNYLGVSSSATNSEANYGFRQYIEGYNIADLGWGTANAKTVTLSFWVRSSLTGTFGGSLRNSNSTRSYVFSYTIAAANTWQQVTATIPGDTTGTWDNTNGAGLHLFISYGCAPAGQGAAGSWSGSDFRSVTGQVNVLGTNGATFYLTGVQLEVGSQATSFEYRQYGQELQLCQRYFQAWTAYGSINYWGGTGRFNFNLLVQMRATPTFALTGTGDAAGLTTLSGGSFASAGTTFGRYDNTTSALSNWQSAAAFIPVSANAEL
jgi:hypothetical protein